MTPCWHAAAEVTSLIADATHAQLSEHSTDRRVHRIGRQPRGSRDHSWRGECVVLQAADMRAVHVVGSPLTDEGQSFGTAWVEVSALRAMQLALDPVPDEAATVRAELESIAFA